MQGSLVEAHLPDLICSLSNDSESGILSLSRDNLNKKIYFGQGSMVFASSNYRPDRLGEYLVRNGKITQTHFDLASEEVAKTGLRLGEVLVKMGLMQEPEMRAGVSDQLRAIIYSLFVWDRGDYCFMPKEKAIAAELAMLLPTYSTILEGIRGIHDPAPIRPALGSLDRVVNFAKDPSTLPGSISLTPEESYIASRVDGQSSVADIINISPVSEAHTLQCLYGLLSVGVLDLGMKSRELAPTKKSPETVPPRDWVPIPANEGAGTATSELSPEERWIHQDIMAKSSALDGGTYYDWLEVGRNANRDEIKKSFHTMIKTYHPDRLCSPRLQDLKRTLEEIISDTTNAYEVLSDPVARKRYDNSLRTEAPRGEDLSPRAFGSPLGGAAQPADPSKKTAEQHYREAKKCFAKGDYHQTAELMDVSLRLDPSNPSFHKLQARTLAKNPNWRRDAEEHFQAALKTNPADIECLIGLGELYKDAGFARKSERMFLRALGWDPENEELKQWLASKKKSPKWRRWLKMRRH